MEPPTVTCHASRAMRVSALLAIPLAALATSSCAGDSSAGDDDNGSGQCAYQVDYRDVTYTDAGSISAQPGKLLGKGTLLGCSDNQEETGTDSPINVYRVDGLEVSTAVAVGDDADKLRLLRVADGNEVPASVKEWLRTHK
jgi:Family of unknown function (DUF6281)